MYQPSEKCLEIVRYFDDLVSDRDLVVRLRTASSVLGPMLPPTIEQQQFDALVSLYDSVLTKKVHSNERDLLRSTLMLAVKAQHHAIAASEFMKWCYRNGKLNSKALNQRIEEADLYRSRN